MPNRPRRPASLPLFRDEPAACLGPLASSSLRITQASLYINTNGAIAALFYPWKRRSPTPYHFPSSSDRRTSFVPLHKYVAVIHPPSPSRLVSVNIFDR